MCTAAAYGARRGESGGAQLVKKGLAEFRVRRRESSKTRFLPRHVRGRKHFARSERRIVRYQRTTEAQNAAKLSRKSGFAAFSTDSVLIHRDAQHVRRGLKRGGAAALYLKYFP